MSELMRTENLSKVFRMGGGEVHAVEDITLTIEKGKSTAL
jgi:ABC-type oligopeptide transport system ATPase subunit